MAAARRSAPAPASPAEPRSRWPVTESMRTRKTPWFRPKTSGSSSPRVFRKSTASSPRANCRRADDDAAIAAELAARHLERDRFLIRATLEIGDDVGGDDAVDPARPSAHCGLTSTIRACAMICRTRRRFRGTPPARARSHPRPSVTSTHAMNGITRPMRAQSINRLRASGSRLRREITQARRGASSDGSTAAAARRLAPADAEPRLHAAQIRAHASAASRIGEQRDRARRDGLGREVVLDQLGDDARARRRDSPSRTCRRARTACRAGRSAATGDRRRPSGSRAAPPAP